MTALLVLLHVLVDLIFQPSRTAYVVFFTLGAAFCGVISLLERKRLAKPR